MTITIALPSKGRLKEDSIAALERAGLKIIAPSDARSYRATVENRDEIEIAYMSASEIARELGAGTIDLGVTGEDLVQETIADWENRVAIGARLGFGRADVI